jgi:diaminopimelate decarboxylase
VLARNVELPDVEPGDVIAILKSGAYGFSASPLGFLSHEWPREIVLDDAARASV